MKLNLLPPVFHTLQVVGFSMYVHIPRKNTRKTKKTEKMILHKKYQIPKCCNNFLTLFKDMQCPIAYLVAQWRCKDHAHTTHSTWPLARAPQGKVFSCIAPCRFVALHLAMHFCCCLHFLQHDKKSTSPPQCLI